MANSSDSTPKPGSRLIDWAAEVRKAWGPEFQQPDTAYKFSNGREFRSTDGMRGGIYAGTST